MKWAITTLRKGTKSPKICRDMFITDSKGNFLLCEVKNGRLASRKSLSLNKAAEIIHKNKLVKTGSCFSDCFTYRDWQSTKLVRDILRMVKA
jgi:hypothetical protein